MRVPPPSVHLLKGPLFKDTLFFGIAIIDDLSRPPKLSDAKDQDSGRRFIKNLQWFQSRWHHPQGRWYMDTPYKRRLEVPVPSLTSETTVL